MSSTAARRVVLGVSGGIAAYKAVDVLRLLQKAGCDVHVTMTASATRFVGPLTFAAISGHAVSAGTLGSEGDAEMAHVEVTRDAALLLVAPATANVVAKLALGVADDWLTTHALACEAPLLLAPAMNQRMWRHAAVRENLRTLERRGARIVPPGEGDLACGEVGPGRMADPEAIVAEALALLGRGTGQLAGRRVLVSSGPTLEDIDPVRYVGNRSSGKMGHAIAAEAARRGAQVVLVSGPVALEDPPGCEVVHVRSAADMARAVGDKLAGVDVAVMAAAVADFAPEKAAASKIRREERDAMSLRLVRTPDVLAEAVAARRGALVVGFAAETGDGWLAAGRQKLRRKRCDLLVVNRVDGPGSTFDREDAEVVVLAKDGGELRVPRAPKPEVARRILDEVGRRLKGGEAPPRRPARPGRMRAPARRPRP